MNKCVLSISMVIVLALCISATGLAQAQDQPAQDRLQAGAWALQFQITNNFNLSSFQGAILSAKFHTGDASAIRVGLDLDGNFQTADETDESVRDVGGDSETTSVSETDNEDSAYSVGLVAQYVMYGNLDAPVKIFGGAGPIVELSSFDSERVTVHQPISPDAMGAVTEQSLDRDTFGVGVSGVLGTEWFAAPFLSISAEYSLAVTYSRTDETRVSSNEVVRLDESRFESSRDRWSIGPRGVRFGLSVYL